MREVFRQYVAVVAVLGCLAARSANASNDCAELEPAQAFFQSSSNSDWWYVHAEPRQTIFGARHAIHSERAFTSWAKGGGDVSSVTTSRSRMGRRSHYHIRLYQGDPTSMRLKFDRALKGLDVSVIMQTSSGAEFKLMDEKRVFSSELELKFPVRKVRQVEVIVHNMLHDRPHLREHAFAHYGKLAQMPVHASMKHTGVLYFKAVRGRDNPRLCDAKHVANDVPWEELRYAKAAEARQRR